MKTAAPLTIGSDQRVLGMAIGIRLAVAAVVIAAVTIPLISTGSTIPAISIPTVAPIGNTGFGGLAGPGTAPRSSSPVSFLTTGGLSAGLARVANLLPGARLALVRLDAHSLIASARLRNGTFKEIVLSGTGSVETIGASTGERLFAISQISPRAVARIVTAMNRHFHVPSGRIDYMVLSSPPGAPAQWIIFSNTPGHPGFTATLSGGRVTRLPN